VKALTGLGDKEFKDKEMEAVAIQRLGTLYVTLASVCCKNCDYEKAIEWYENALDVLRTQPNNRFLYVKALTGLGTTWFSLGNTEKATEAIQEAQTLAKRESDTGYYYEYNFFLSRHNIYILVKCSDI
jgi:pentatricopeptide repeat protein